MNSKLVSVICPCYNEQSYIVACIESILAQDWPKDQMELLLMDGGSSDDTRKLIADMQQRYPMIHLLDNPGKTAPAGVNRGVQAARGEYVVRIDAHSTYPANYISTLIHALETLPDAQNVGACIDTLPANSTKEARAVAITCSSRMGVGSSDFRVLTTGAPLRTDTVPFGCWRKKWLDKMGAFDEQLPKAEDDEFNARTLLAGGAIWLIPTLHVQYFARPTLSKMTAMFFQYGQYKPVVMRKLGQAATIRQFIPPMFVLFLLGGLTLPLLPGLLRLLYSAVLTLYFCLLIAEAIRNRNILVVPAMLLAHVGYGIGYWTGIKRMLLGQSLSTQITR